MVVVRAFGSAEDGCGSSDVQASVVAADGPGGRGCTVRLTGTADAAAEPLRLSPELVPVARQLVANGVAALAELLTACRQGGPAVLLATAGELRLWVQPGDDRRGGAIALARRHGGRDTVVSAPRGADLHTALARVERFLRGAGFLEPLPNAG
jgi:hypothetical protein